MEKSEDYIDSLKKKLEKYRSDLCYPYAGTEHLFMALLSDTNSSVTKYLNKEGITLKSFKTALIKTVGQGSKDNIKENVYTPLLTNILTESLHFATDYNITISPEVVALHLFRIGEGVAMRVLESMGFDDKKQDSFYHFIEDQIRIVNIGVDFGEDLDSSDVDSITTLFGGGSSDKFTGLTDLRKVVEQEHTTVVGFETELEDLIKSLLRYKKPNVILLGEPGVGKTALVEKLAIAINKGEVPPILANYRILQLSISAALAGTKYRGEFEERIENILKEISKCDNVVLFIDEIHNIVGAGASNESTLDASNILKPYLARGAIKVIGATTNEEYERIREDGALARRFKTMEILEPNKEQTMNILKAMKPAMLERYGVKVTDKQLDNIYFKSTYRKGRMPDIALDELEEYCIDIYYDKCKKEKVNV